MGTELRTIEVQGRVSRHNSQKDRDDDADWEDLAHRIRLIALEHRYAGLDIQVWGVDD